MNAADALNVIVSAFLAANALLSWFDLRANREKRKKLDEELARSRVLHARMVAMLDQLEASIGRMR